MLVNFILNGKGCFMDDKKIKLDQAVADFKKAMDPGEKYKKKWVQMSLVSTQNKPKFIRG